MPEERAIRHDQILCSGCGSYMARTDDTCPYCSAHNRWARPATGTGKNKTKAIILAALLLSGTWLYTFREDARKVLLSTILGASAIAATFFFAGVGTILAAAAFAVLLSIWTWAVVDTASRKQQWYETYDDPGRRVGFRSRSAWAAGEPYRVPVSPGEIIVVAAGGAMVVASVLPWARTTSFNQTYSATAWESPVSEFAVIAVILSVVAALTVVARLAGDGRFGRQSAGLIVVALGSIAGVFLLATAEEISEWLAVGFYAGAACTAWIIIGGFLMMSSKERG